MTAALRMIRFGDAFEKTHTPHHVRRIDDGCAFHPLTTFTIVLILSLTPVLLTLGSSRIVSSRVSSMRGKLLMRLRLLHSFEGFQKMEELVQSSKDRSAATRSLSVVSNTSGVDHVVSGARQVGSTAQALMFSMRLRRYSTGSSGVHSPHDGGSPASWRRRATSHPQLGAERPPSSGEIDAISLGQLQCNLSTTTSTPSRAPESLTTLDAIAEMTSPRDRVLGGGFRTSERDPDADQDGAQLYPTRVDRPRAASAASDPATPRQLLSSRI
jgi:hypothetical protein